MFEIIDIGVNLMHQRYHHDRDEVINRAVSADVTKMIITGSTLKNSQSALEMSKEYPETLFSTAGIHPHNAKDCNDGVIKDLRKLASHKEVVAIGECGLDFDRDFSPRDVQEKWFEEQVKLACELKMPLFLHEREAHDKFVKIMSEYKNQLPKSVVHCFTGNKQELKTYLEMGFYIGITAAICDERKSQLQELVKLIPLDKLMIETDAPFMLPRSMKPKPENRRNESAFLPYVLKMIAKCINKPEMDVATGITNSTRNFFEI